jgi:hypothetical protein
MSLDDVMSRILESKKKYPKYTACLLMKREDQGYAERK